MGGESERMGCSGESARFPLESRVGTGIGRAFSIIRGDLSGWPPGDRGDRGDDGRIIIDAPMSRPSFSGVGGGGGDLGGSVGSCTSDFSGKNGVACFSSAVGLEFATAFVSEDINVDERLKMPLKRSFADSIVLAAFAASDGVEDCA